MYSQTSERLENEQLMDKIQDLEHSTGRVSTGGERFTSEVGLLEKKTGAFRRVLKGWWLEYDTQNSIVIPTVARSQLIIKFITIFFLWFMSTLLRYR